MKLKSVFDASEIKSEFELAEINSNFAIPIWKYVVQNPDCVWDEIPSLPSATYTILHSKFKSLTSSLHSLFHSSDCTTSKLLIKLQNGAFVEAVIMRYDTRLGMCGGKPRPGGCLFIYQLLPWYDDCDQGMGEPLNNYNIVVEAVCVMLKQPFQLSPKRITISTGSDKLIQKTMLKVSGEEAMAGKQLALSNLDEVTRVIHRLIPQRLKNRLTRDLPNNIIKV